MLGEGAFVGIGCPLAVSIETGLWNMFWNSCVCEFMKCHHLVWGVWAEAWNTLIMLALRSPIGYSFCRKIGRSQNSVMGKLFCSADSMEWLYQYTPYIPIISRIWWLIRVQFKRDDWKPSGISLMYWVPAVKTSVTYSFLCRRNVMAWRLS